MSLSSGGLAREYGFTDLDGSVPDCWRYVADSAGRRQAGRCHGVSLNPVFVWAVWPVMYG